MLVQLSESLTTEYVSVDKTTGGLNYTMLAFNQTYDLALVNYVYEGVSSGTSL